MSGQTLVAIKLIDGNVEENTTVSKTRLRFTHGVQYFKSENILFYLLSVMRTYTNWLF